MVAVLQCIERGLFTLDDPADVARFLPEWSNPEVITGWAEDGTAILQPAKAKLTLRMLLTHTSGLAYEFLHPDLLKWRKSRGEGPQEWRHLVTESFVTPLVFEPGTSWTYGSGVDVVGLMVARASACSLEDYMRRNIFDVLGMQHTTFRLDDHELRGKNMSMSTRLPSGELIEGSVPGFFLHPKDDYGGAGLFSTASDILKLLKSILSSDGKLLQPRSIETLFTPCLSEQQQKGLHQNLSVPPLAALLTPGEPVHGTPGAGTWQHSIGGLIGLHQSGSGLQCGWLQWVGAFGLKWWIDRKGGTCGIFATQLLPPGDLKYAQLLNMFQKEVAQPPQ